MYIIYLSICTWRHVLWRRPKRRVQDTTRCDLRVVCVDVALRRRFSTLRRFLARVRYYAFFVTHDDEAFFLFVRLFGFSALSFWHGRVRAWQRHKSMLLRIVPTAQAQKVRPYWRQIQTATLYYPAIIVYESVSSKRFEVSGCKININRALNQSERKNIKIFISETDILYIENEN